MENSKYEFLTGDNLLPFNQRQKIEQSKFIYSLLGKAFEEQKNKLIEEQERKQVDTITNQNQRLWFLNNKDMITKIFVKKYLKN